MSIPETTASGSRESWGSRFGFIMATAGRKVRLTLLAGMTRATGSSIRPWNAIGWMGTTTATIIMGYYLMLLGWIAGYMGMAISGELGAPPQGELVGLWLIGS